MKPEFLRNLKPIHYAIAAGLLLIGWVFGMAFSGGEHDHTPVASIAKKASKWTCSMHPQILSEKPGKCPICGMALVSLDELGNQPGGKPVLVMTEAARQLARIRTTKVERKLVETEIRLVGKVTFDETHRKTVAAYFPARIDRLYVNYTGVEVRKNDHLAEVYSPDLLTAQTELLSAIKFKSNIETARDKLRLWGLSDQRIQAIEQRGKTSDRMDIDTPLAGIVIEKMINEGDYVKTGPTAVHHR